MERKEPEQVENIFLEAYDTYADAIFRYCLYKTSHRGKALDLTQETFIRTWEYLQEGKLIDDMRPFLYRVAKNAIIDDYRKKAATSLDTMVEGGFDIADSRDVAEETITAFEYQQTLDAVQKLEEKYRDVLLLRFVEELSIEEIAEITDESKNNISVRIHRALEKIKPLLDENHD